MMVEQNPTWGYDRIVGALANLGHTISDETVGNILKRNGIPPAPSRKPTLSWSDFIKTHGDVIAACDFFTAEVFTPTGLVTYYVLFFIKVGSRDVHIAGITPHPNTEWMKQIARNVSMYEEHYREERNHQGKGNVLLLPSAEQAAPANNAPIECKQRLGGLLNFYHRKAA